LFEFPYVRAA